MTLTPRKPFPYWPHMGIVLGLVMTTTGATLRDGYLITAGTNFLMISGVILSRREK